MPEPMWMLLAGAAMVTSLNAMDLREQRLIISMSPLSKDTSAGKSTVLDHEDGR